MVEPGSLLAIVLGMGAVAMGAAVQTSIGMGLNLFTVPILALIDPVYVPGAVLMHSGVLSCLASWRLRADINRRELALCAAGVVLGTLAGMGILLVVSPQYLPRAFGILVVVAVLVTVAGLRVAPSTRNVLTASAAAGVMGTIAGMHGPPIAILYQHETPARIRSTLLPFFALANPIALVGLAAIGQFGWGEFAAGMLLLPGLIAGYLAAPLLIRVLTPGMVRAALLTISAISGALLALRG